ncbi:hypothetical protein [Burkholderia pseudomultivorans]|uniref:hypothetical protein n=1 Tax=Burkholderia pseudomultivorans TaxID=1207504 RepID=UPI003002BE11
MRYRAPAGALLFQTPLITPELVARGIEQWWYCVPRNGYFSFSRATRLRCWRRSMGSNSAHSVRNCTWLSTVRRGGFRSTFCETGARSAATSARSP